MAKKYEAIAAFKDGQDDNKQYNKGDRYPFPANKKVSADRLKELSSHDNKAGYPVIKEIEEGKEE
ncbi:hypothetical protein LIT38_20365 [Bacillus sp. CMF12]|uniref:hypothetical protein n=1 Tax=Bacillus sp. CMF12 TaxID=2884834 RepID=UPI00207A1587|nr:hypothetical protein [Bacillus sp. CMF12]USK48866.1 hypothetical protein LIT38_20365 [Bacillus sp. CMF12]